MSPDPDALRGRGSLSAVRLRQLLDPRGRSDRTEYLTVTALGWAAFAACGLLAHGIGPEFAPAATVLAIAVTAAIAIVGSIISIKRLHDWGRSGWWTVLILLAGAPLAAMAEPAWFPDNIVALGIVLQAVYSVANLVVFSALPGQRATNRFGPPPGGREAAAATA